MHRRVIPDAVGLAVAMELEKNDSEQFPDQMLLKQLKAVDLAYRKHMLDDEIAKKLDIPRTTLSQWMTKLLGPSTGKIDEQSIASVLSKIKGRSKVVFKFSDVYKESVRKDYAVSESKDDGKLLKQGRKEFRSFVLRAGIDLACFTGEDKKLHFNSDGKEFAVEVLNNRTNRTEGIQKSERYEVYRLIRSGHFTFQHREYYEQMLDAACSNLRDLKEAYPDSHYPDESDVRHDFWENTCKRNGNFAAFPGMAHLGTLPWQLTESWFFVLDDIVYLDPLIEQEFADCCERDNDEQTKRKDRWVTYLMCVLVIRLYEHEKIMSELEQFPAECLEEFYWLLGYLLAYTNKYEDQGITRTYEEKWASRELAEDARLRENWKMMKDCFNKELPPPRKHDSIKAARIFREWANKSLSVTRRLSVEDVIECANMLLDPESNLE